MHSEKMGRDPFNLVIRIVNIGVDQRHVYSNTVLDRKSQKQYTSPNEPTDNRAIAG